MKKLNSITENKNKISEKFKASIFRNSYMKFRLLPVILLLPEWMWLLNKIIYEKLHLQMHMWWCIVFDLHSIPCHQPLNSLHSIFFHVFTKFDLHIQNRILCELKSIYPTSAISISISIQSTRLNSLYRNLYIYLMECY